MKNAMKKLMSLVLVAMILVSAVPFAASADTITLNVDVVVDGRNEGSFPVTLGDGEIIKTADLEKQVMITYGSTNGVSGNYTISWHVSNDATGKEIDSNTTEATVTLESFKVVPNDPKPSVHEVKFYDVNMNLVATKEVKDGGTVSAPAASKANVPAGYEFLGWVNVDNGMPYLSSTEIYSHTSFVAKASKVETTTGGNSSSNNNSSNNNSSSNNNGSSSTGSNSSSGNNGNTVNMGNGNVSNTATSYSKFAYPVYLNIYTDTTVGTVKKTINITNGIAADGKVSLSEVKNLVPNYYTADVDATGIIYDGLYPAQGNWVLDYVVDQKYDIIEGLYEAASNNYVYINVMLTNAVALSNSGTSTNPKTGDEIYMAVTGMALSACALATVLYISKKRVIQ